MNLIDAHCHLQDSRFDADLETVLQRAKDVGITRLICCGTAPDDWEQVHKLSLQYDLIIPAYGLHPWYVDRRTDSWLDDLRDRLDSSPGALVGEIGLDHALRKRDDLDQLGVFNRQLELAAEMSRPAVIHCRQAWGALREALVSASFRLPRFMIHSFSGSPEMVRELAGKGAFFSFSGSITFDRNVRGRRALAAVPSDRLLIETDAPDITPVVNGAIPEKSVRNEPALLTAVLERVAACRGVPPERLAELALENTRRFLGYTPDVEGL